MCVCVSLSLAPAAHLRCWHHVYTTTFAYSLPTATPLGLACSQMGPWLAVEIPSLIGLGLIKHQDAKTSE